MIDEKEMIEILKKKVQFFYGANLPVHVSLKTDRWQNGFIKEISADFFILNDFVEGKKPIFYIEILPNGINEYKEEE